jgi:hypothetical protein
MHKQIATPAFIASFATFELSAFCRIGLNSNIGASRLSPLGYMNMVNTLLTDLFPASA